MIGAGFDDTNFYHSHGTQTEISLFGFTSTFINRKSAELYAYSDEASGKIATLLVIEWTNGVDEMYYMDTGAYRHEDEVLLLDGVQLEVISVE